MSFFRSILCPALRHFGGRMQNEQGFLGAALGGLAGAAASILGANASQRNAEAAANRMAQAANVPIDKNAFNIKNVDQRSQLADTRSAAGQQQADVANQQRQQLIQQLQNQASGQGPSLATAQLKAAQDRNLAQQLAMAAQRPNTALGARTLMRQQGEAGAQLAQQANQAQMQEALQAQQLLGQNINQSEQLGAQLAQSYMQQGFSMDQAQQAAQQALQQMRVNQALGVGQLQSANYKEALGANQANLSGLLGGIGGVATGIGSGGSFSDTLKSALTQQTKG